MPGVEVRPEPLDSPVALRLIAELNAELSLDYPPAQRFHSLDAEEVAEGAGAFVVLWLDGEPAGCGAVRLLPRDGIPPDRIPPNRILGGGIPPDTIPGEAVAELKRMYVVPAARGRGLARAILNTLEDRAAALGASRVVLETGDKALAALALYQSSGYARVPCFGAYAASPTSICFEKRLAR